MISSDLAYGAGIGAILALLGFAAFKIRRSATPMTSDGALALESTEPPPSLVIPSFTESFDANVFQDALVQAARHRTSRAIRTIAPEGANVAVNVVRLANARRELVVEVSKKGRSLLNSGRAFFTKTKDGKYLIPQLKNRKGKILEVLKGSRGRQYLAKAASLTSAITSAAHMISAADVIDKVNQSNRKLDTLLAYRRVDQMSTLERIYGSTWELLLAEPHEGSEMQRWHLRQELRELRIAWRREFSHHLENISNPEDASWLTRMLTSRDTADGEIHLKISEGELQLAMIETALKLDFLLAESHLSGWKPMIAMEMKEMSRLRDLIQAKTAYISKQNSEILAEPILSRMAHLTDGYGRLAAPEDPVDG